uniref:Uncharacterized protein n=1 Tax=Caenorhabditis japonica TaxID=281687 RepID=A0A8R1EID4_CAEJA
MAGFLMKSAIGWGSSLCRFARSTEQMKCLHYLATSSLLISLFLPSQLSIYSSTLFSPFFTAPHRNTRHDTP